ncbi:MAG: DUF4292 domain-containing protein [Bacteroidota bacterium]|nr:DUF4292 domain-containing protein [Bacteroidota bacterium]
MNKYWLAAIAVILIFSACKRAKQVQTPPQTPPPVETPDETFLGRLRQNAPEYKWIRLRGTIKYDDGKNNYTATNFIRLRKDSIIWTMVNLSVIEIARGVVTQDSVKALIHPTKEYDLYDLNYLRKKFAIEGLGLAEIQQLLIGHPPILRNKHYDILDKEGLILLTRNSDSLSEQMLIDPSTHKLSEYTLERGNQRLIIRYSGYRQVENLLMPGMIAAEVYNPEKILLTLNITDHRLNDEDEAPFFIPESYNRRQ